MDPRGPDPWVGGVGSLGFFARANELDRLGGFTKLSEIHADNGLGRIGFRDPTFLCFAVAEGKARSRVCPARNDVSRELNSSEDHLGHCISSTASDMI